MLPDPRTSEFVRTLRFLRESGGLPAHLADGLRPLRGDEIRTLEARGNRCDDWSRVRVSQGFIADRVWSSLLIGTCVLGAFHDDSGLPAGIYRSTLRDSVIGDNCRIYDCPLLEAAVCDHDATMIATRVSGSAAAAEGAYANGIALAIGLETGERRIAICGEMTSAIVSELLAEGGRGETVLADRWNAYTEEIADHARVGWSYIGRRALCDTATIHAAWLGAAASVRDYATVSNATILSSEREPSTVSAGARVSDAVLHWSTAVSEGATVARACLLEHVEVAGAALVRESIIGPNSALAEVEVTASCLGPFSAAHHHSLVIAASWPDGRGNVGYGANVGSNHTGRAPDQEVRPGEGMFFGLDCAVKFPADFSRAPYTVIATGVMTAPQRMTLPMSLIAQVPPSLVSHAGMGVNMLVPAWMIRDNLYALIRAEQKYRRRNRATHEALELRVLRPALIPLLQAAHDALTAVDGSREFWNGRDIPAIGANLLREDDRTRGLDAYAWLIRMIELRDRAASEAGLAPAEVNELVELLAGLLEGARRSRDRDLERGTRIIEDYTTTHLPPAEDPVLLHLRQELRAEVEKLGADPALIA